MQKATAGGARHRVASCDLEVRLREEGYGTVDLLDEALLERVRAVRRRLGPAPGDLRSGWHSDVWSEDGSYREAVAHRLTQVLRAPLAGLAPEHDILAATHLVKWPGAGEVKAHREPTFVDEDHYRSLTVWIAMEDVDERTGCLWVMPGSHRCTPRRRPHQDPANVDHRSHAEFAVDAVPVPLRAGEALVFDHAVLHGSGPMTGGSERVAVAIILVPRGVTPTYGLRDEDGRVIEVPLDERFFVDNRLSELDEPALIAAVRDGLQAATAPQRGRADPLAWDRSDLVPQGTQGQRS